MVDATISRFRMRDLARRGRFRSEQSRSAAPLGACASRRESDPRRPALRSLSQRAPERPARAPEKAISWHQPSSGGGVDDGA